MATSWVKPCHQDLVSVSPSFSGMLSTWKGRRALTLDIYLLSRSFFPSASTWRPGTVSHWTDPWASSIVLTDEGWVMYPFLELKVEWGLWNHVAWVEGCFPKGGWKRDYMVVMQSGRSPLNGKTPSPQCFGRHMSLHLSAKPSLWRCMILQNC